MLTNRFDCEFFVSLDIISLNFTVLGLDLLVKHLYNVLYYLCTYYNLSGPKSKNIPIEEATFEFVLFFMF